MIFLSSNFLGAEYTLDLDPPSKSVKFSGLPVFGG